jgi:F-type H+-transporting ATPase subunit b
MIARAATALTAVLIALACALPAWASGDAEHAPAASQVLWQALNLALLLGIIIYVARKPASSFFKQRRETVSGDLDEAAELLRTAEARYASWNRKLLELEAELEEIKVAARRRAEEEREKLLAEASAAAERIKSDAVTAVEQELRRAQDELHDEASTLAAELAATILRDQVQQPDRDRLLDEFITHVERIPVRDESGR